MAEVDGGLPQMIALVRSGNPKTHDPVEHGGEQVGGGLHLDRDKLTGLDACGNSSRLCL